MDIIGIAITGVGVWGTIREWKRHVKDGRDLRSIIILYVMLAAVGPFLMMF